MRNKSVFFLVVLILAVLLIIAGIYFLLTKKPSTNDQPKEFTQTELINIVIPGIKDYCQGLQSKAVNSACPTCKFPNPEGCVVIEGELGTGMGDECTVQKNNDGSYTVQAKRDLIYGRNDRPGTVTLAFTISPAGKIISKDLPERTCV